MILVESKLTIKWIVITADSLDDWLGYIEEASLVVSGRFHHSIAAASLKTNFIVLNSNTPKIEGLCQVLGYDSIIRYDDVELLTKLLDKTQEKLNITNPPCVLDVLCNKAIKNFKALERIAQQKSLNI